MEYSSTASAAMFSAASTIVDSTCTPVPVRSRISQCGDRRERRMQARQGIAGPRGIRGGPSAGPVIQAMPLACSMVCAKPTRSRHGPSSPNAGIRTIVALGFAACTTSHSRSKLAITRGEKFSMTRSLWAMRSSAACRPCGVLSSRLMPRLLVLLHRNTGPHSHHWSQLGGRPPANRMPSGRRTPSTLMTSAPSAASTWVAIGPAQNAVKSTTRTPVKGSVSGAFRCLGRLPGRPFLVASATRPLSAPSAGASSGRRGRYRR